VRKLLGIVTTLLVGATAAVFITPGTAAADPSSADWAALRQCESGGNYKINTGNGYYGAYQFDVSTWRSVGGAGRPDQASAAEQNFRALYLYRMRGWAPWVCAALVGLREDSDGGSGVKPTRGATSTPSTGGTPVTSTAKVAYPGKQFHEGDSSTKLAAWQKQMGKMGYGLTGTGYFGAKTKAAVLALQRKAGLNVVGYIGPKTWAAAWNTKYKKGATNSSPSTSTYVPATNASCSVGKSKAPAFSSKTAFRYGHTYRELQCFQRQLGSRGYGLTGTGYYGPSTKAAVLDLQKRNHLPTTGVVGPMTWKAAWEGKAKR
jgi:peptidoglycan hydrolase-like protein with peptidoglycan-binding domain